MVKISDVRLLVQQRVTRSLGLKQFDLLPINNFVQDLWDFFPLCPINQGLTVLNVNDARLYCLWSGYK